MLLEQLDDLRTPNFENCGRTQARRYTTETPRAEMLHDRTISPIICATTRRANTPDRKETPRRME